LTAFDLVRPALDQAGDAARDQSILADFEQRPDVAGGQRRAERRGGEHLALLADHEFADIRRPAWLFGRGGAHVGAVLEAVVGPDVDDLVQRADFGVKEGGELGMFLAGRQRFPEALLSLGHCAGLEGVGSHFDDHFLYLPWTWTYAGYRIATLAGMPRGIPRGLAVGGGRMVPFGEP
jgi:hypothetical protein